MNDELTPRRIVEYLDQYIIGQQDAKKSVAVALRNRLAAPANFLLKLQRKSARKIFS